MSLVSGPHADPSQAVDQKERRAGRLHKGGTSSRPPTPTTFVGVRSCRSSMAPTRPDGLDRTGCSETTMPDRPFEDPRDSKLTPAKPNSDMVGRPAGSRRRDPTGQVRAGGSYTDEKLFASIDKDDFGQRHLTEAGKCDRWMIDYAGCLRVHF